MKNLFISVSNPEESRQVSQKLDSLGYHRYSNFSDTESYIKLYKEDKTYNSFDDDSFWGGVCDKMTAAEFLNPAARGLPECFYVNASTPLLISAVRDKLISLGYKDRFVSIYEGLNHVRFFIYKDKSFTIFHKDHIVTYPYKITEEVSLDLLFSQPDPPVETEIPGILTGNYTLFKKENGDFSIRERGVEILTVSAENVARIKEEVEKFNDLSVALPTYFSIHIPAPELSEIVQKRLFELGFVNFHLKKTIERTDRPYINVNVSDKCFYFYRSDYTDFPEISISSLWKTRESVVLPGLVPGYNVIIGENGVKIGCQAVSFEDFTRGLDSP